MWLCPVCHNELTYSGQDQIDAISQTTFSNAFSIMKNLKMNEFRLGFHWSLFLRFELTPSSIGSDNLAWRQPGDKPLSELMVVSLTTHICVTRPQWVNDDQILFVCSFKFRGCGSLMPNSWEKFGKLSTMSRNKTLTSRLKPIEISTAFHKSQPLYSRGKFH